MGTTADGSKTVKELFDGHKVYDFPKPVKLIKHLLSIGTSEKEEIVLDFFAGSCTLAQAVAELNLDDGGARTFVCAQIPERTSDDSEARQLGYDTIADVGKERIRRAVKKLDEEEASKLKSEGTKPGDRGFKVFKLTSSNFEIWDGTAAGNVTGDGSAISDQILDAVENVKENRSREDMLYEVLLRAGWPLTTEVEVLQVANGEIFAATYGNGTMFVCLEDPITEEILRGMMNREPAQVVCLDTAFHGNDQLKTNTVLEMRESYIEFRTI